MTSGERPPATAALVEGIDVDAVYNAVASCPGVAGVGAPGLGALATYLPGRRICGVRVSPDVVEVEIRTHWGVAAREVVAGIRAALAPVVAGRPVDLRLVDIELPGQAAATADALGDDPLVASQRKPESETT